jgi:hypothetical protein
MSLLSSAPNLTTTQRQHPPQPLACITPPCTQAIFAFTLNLSSDCKAVVVTKPVRAGEQIRRIEARPSPRLSPHFPSPHYPHFLRVPGMLSCLLYGRNNPVGIASTAQCDAIMRERRNFPLVPPSPPPQVPQPIECTLKCNFSWEVLDLEDSDEDGGRRVIVTSGPNRTMRYVTMKEPPCRYTYAPE